jgi:transcription initiation factor TFIIIB Brf1 subunit/transcription initiation factor TFIIB
MVIVQDLEDTKKIWHKAWDNVSDTRNGNPSSLTLYNQGLATLICDTNSDTSRNVINSMMITRLNKMRYHDKRSQINKSARNLIRAFRQF